MTIGIDSFMHKALRDNHLEGEDENVHLEGRDLAAEMKHQRAELPAGAVKATLAAVPKEVRNDIIEDGLLHAATHGLKRVAGEAVEYVRDQSIAAMANDAAHGLVKSTRAVFETAGLIKLEGEVTIEAAVENLHEGDELHDAALRELAYATTMSFCRDALPDGFRKEFWDKTVANGEAVTKVAQSLTDQGAAVHDAFVANVRDGQRSALDRGIGSPKELEGALRSNADLRARYEGDLAFRQGVDSAIWAQQHGQVDALRAKLGESAQPAAFQARA